MQLDIFKEPLQYEANASEKKLDAFKQFHTKYASDWIRLDYLSEAFISDVKNTAERIRKDFDALVVIGIGGSYIGAKAFIDTLGSYFPIYFTGNMLDSGCITKLLHELRDKRYAINVISKSGTTMETKLVFEIFLEDMKKKGIDFANSLASELVTITPCARSTPFFFISSRKISKTSFVSIVVPDLLITFMA